MLGAGAKHSSFFNAPEQPRPANAFDEGYWTEILVEILNILDNIPTRIATLVTSAVNGGIASSGNEREKRKLELLPVKDCL